MKPIAITLWFASAVAAFVAPAAANGFDHVYGREVDYERRAAAGVHQIPDRRE